MPRNEALCARAAKWIRNVPSPGNTEARRESHGRDVFAPFTGQDGAAFDAFVHAVELYTMADEPGRELALTSMRSCVLAAQQKVRHVFREVIACVYDWPERERLWRRMGLDADGRSLTEHVLQAQKDRERFLPAFRERDLGGPTDGRIVLSDADPGL